VNIAVLGREMTDGGAARGEAPSRTSANHTRSKCARRFAATVSGWRQPCPHLAISRTTGTASTLARSVCAAAARAVRQPPPPLTAAAFYCRVTRTSVAGGPPGPPRRNGRRRPPPLATAGAVPRRNPATGPLLPPPCAPRPCRPLSLACIPGVILPPRKGRSCTKKEIPIRGRTSHLV
jgi:hypothetical protein